MLLFKVIVVVSTLLTTACGLKFSDVVEDAPDEVETEMPIAAEPISHLEPVKVKKTAISSEVLFLLMTAEIAGQRGQFGIALDGYLRAAKRSHDLSVVKRAAKMALFLKDDKRLTESLDIWSALEADSVELKTLMAIAALKLDDHDVALESLRYILMHDAGSFKAKVLAIMKSLVDDDGRALAYAVLDHLSTDNPENAEIYFIQALLDAQKKQFVLAQENLTAALRYQPKWIDALLLQAQIYISQGKLEQAERVLKDALAEENNIKIKEQLAQLLIQQAKFNQAADMLEVMVAETEKNGEIKFKLALVYLQLEKSEAAQVILEQLVNRKAFQGRAAFYLGRLELRRKNFPQALIWFDTVNIKPYRFEARFQSVLVLLSELNYNASLTRLEDLKNTYPNKLSKLVLLESEVYNQMNQPQASFDVLTKALLVKADDVDILYARALVAEKLQLLDVLEGDLKYIIEKQPNNANALNSLGYTLADKTTRYAEAKSLLERALSIKPNEATIQDSYGWLLFKMGDFKQALVYLKKAFKQAAEAEIAAHLVDVLWALQDYDNAKEFLKQASEKFPDDALLLEVEQRLLK